MEICQVYFTKIFSQMQNSYFIAAVGQYVEDYGLDDQGRRHYNGRDKDSVSQGACPEHGNNQCPKGHSKLHDGYHKGNASEYGKLPLRPYLK